VSYLIDTNIIAEVRKGDRSNPHVAAWYGSIADGHLFLSTLVLGEIRGGGLACAPRNYRARGQRHPARASSSVSGLVR
jgi:predicted nucleic acid-binding protein